MGLVSISKRPARTLAPTANLWQLPRRHAHAKVAAADARQRHFAAQQHVLTVSASRPRRRVAAAAGHSSPPAAAEPAEAGEEGADGAGSASAVGQRAPEAAESKYIPQAAETQAVQPAVSIEREILSIALPTLATLAADPLASLVSTGFVGRLGAAPLAAAGVALSVYNSVTKLLNMPLLAVTTSSVAQALGAQRAGEADAEGTNGTGANNSLSTAVSASIVLALLTGLMQAALLGVWGPRGLVMWGASPDGPLLADAAAYLGVRALAAPATVLMLVLQGCFRGLGDTRTPFTATLLANCLNIALEPVLIFWAGWGVAGAATAVGLSQAVACLVLLALLRRRCQLRLVGSAALRHSLDFLRPTGLLVLRTLAITTVYSIATSTAARTDPSHAASHQIAYQLWLASSLLADSLAVAAQTLLARSVAAGQQHRGQVVVRRTLQMALALGCTLALGLAVGRGGIAQLFSSDPGVLRCLALLMPAVIATQPINALAFVMDGVLYGVGGFQYAASAMVIACIPAATAMLLGTRLAAGLASSAGGGAAASAAATAVLDGQLYGVWAGLATLMLTRFLTLYIPLLLRHPPFDKLAPYDDSSPDASPTS